MISILAALDTNNGIGKDNNLLCRLRDDMRNFKELTTGNIVVMGRKTFESLPKGALPNRENIVLSRSKVQKIPGCTIMNNVDDLLEYAKQSDKEIFIIGGGEIYRLFLPYANKLYLSFIDHSFEADTYFPEINFSSWKSVFSKRFEQSERNDFAFRFEIFERI